MHRYLHKGMSVLTGKNSPHKQHA